MSDYQEQAGLWLPRQGTVRQDQGIPTLIYFPSLFLLTFSFLFLPPNFFIDDPYLQEFTPNLKTPCAQFIFGVDKDSESDKAGVRANDFIVEVILD